EMEGEVGVPAGGGVMNRIHEPREPSADAGEVAVACALAGEADGLALDGDARLHHVIEDARLLSEAEGEEIGEHGEVGRLHESAPAVADVEHPQHGERAQG